jgi:hypothetical protein
MRNVSYDLAVWDGERPADDVAAAAQVDALYDRYMNSDVGAPPTPTIAAYARALVDRYPDIGTDAGEASPWTTGPWLDLARGPLVYFSIGWSGARRSPRGPLK